MARARALDDVRMADEHQRSVSDPVWRMLTGAFAFVIGVFVCGSVGSYAPADPSWNAATGGEARNLFGCLLYTSPSPRDQRGSRMPSSA